MEHTDRVVTNVENDSTKPVKDVYSNLVFKLQNKSRFSSIPMVTAFVIERF